MISQIFDNTIKERIRYVGYVNGTYSGSFLPQTKVTQSIVQKNLGVFSLLLSFVLYNKFIATFSYIDYILYKHYEQIIIQLNWLFFIYTIFLWKYLLKLTTCNYIPYYFCCLIWFYSYYKKFPIRCKILLLNWLFYGRCNVTHSSWNQALRS